MTEATGIQFNVDAALAKLGELVQQHGPDAVNLAAQVVQVNAAGNLIVGVLALAAAGGCAALIKRPLKVVREESAKDFMVRNDARELFGVVGVVALTIVGTILAIVSAVSLFDVWTWIGLFNPKLALAHEVLSRIGR